MYRSGSRCGAAEEQGFLLLGVACDWICAFYGLDGDSRSAVFAFQTNLPKGC